jgi:hypothetical protein
MANSTTGQELSSTSPTDGVGRQPIRAISMAVSTLVDPTLLALLTERIRLPLEQAETEVDIPRTDRGIDQFHDAATTP